MPNAAKPGPETVPATYKSAPEVAFDAVEASENAPRALGSAAPPALPQPAHPARQAVVDPPASGSAPKRRANLRNAIAEEGREPAAAPPRVARHPSDPDASPSLS